MKLVSYLRAEVPSFGAAVDGAIVDLVQASGGRYTSLKGLLAADALHEVPELVKGRSPACAVDEATLLPVVPDPAKIWCCGLNYREHVEETQREVTEQPTFFLRVAASQVGHGQPIVRPRESTQLDFEGEIAVIIGRGGRRIAEGEAGAHVAGYACYNDGSIRDWQRNTSQWGPGKNFWRTGGFGPGMVTADEIPFGTTMTLTTRLDGNVMQNATTDMLIHSIARQIAYVSAVAPLEPGDVIVTGTPGGVGSRRQPPVWMKAGDVVEVEVDRIGTLRNVVADEG
jgi:2-keto-4-pentenoate hydratase/2-oxohepta-3-ene-1,7-dioic acid hydratase in catechol pathway